MKLSELKKNPNNPRIIKDEKFQKLCNSIKEFPKMMELRPIVYDADMVVLGGNMRLAALKELGYKEVPNEWVKSAKDLTEEEKRRFIIADNVGFGEWEWDALANEWEVEELSGYGLDVPSFDAEEVLDYSDKNKEINTDDFSDKMFLKLEYSSEEFIKVKQELQNKGITAENALYKFLFPNEQPPF